MGGVFGLAIFDNFGHFSNDFLGVALFNSSSHALQS